MENSVVPVLNDHQVAPIASKIQAHAHFLPDETAVC